MFCTVLPWPFLWSQMFINIHKYRLIYIYIHLDLHKSTLTHDARQQLPNMNNNNNNNLNLHQPSLLFGSFFFKLFIPWFSWPQTNPRLQELLTVFSTCSRLDPNDSLFWLEFLGLVFGRGLTFKNRGWQLGFLVISHSLDEENHSKWLKVYTTCFFGKLWKRNEKKNYLRTFFREFLNKPWIVRIFVGEHPQPGVETGRLKGIAEPFFCLRLGNTGRIG